MVIIKGNDLDVVVSGLMVVGEVVCALVYGVNRFGVNFFFDIVVFGWVCVNWVVEINRLGKWFVGMIIGYL